MMGLISYSFPLSNPPCAVFFKDSRATHGKGSMSVNPQIDFSFALLLTVIDPKNLKRKKIPKLTLKLYSFYQTNPQTFNFIKLTLKLTKLNQINPNFTS